LLATAKLTQTRISDQRIVILGAGSSAVGISDQIVAAMMLEGTAELDARAKLWLVDSQGLVHTKRPKLDSFKQKYAQPPERTINWQGDDPLKLSFGDTVRNVHPTVLIGTSAQPGAFTEEIVREMSKHAGQPVIFPLSNPTSKCEAVPSDLLDWTEGRALIATGSPISAFRYQGREVRIGQCNNSFVFPGVGLGVIASGARRVTDAMFVAAARVLSEFAPVMDDPSGPLYPPLEQVREISFKVALAVAREAQRAGLAEAKIEDLEQAITSKMWQPHYVPLKLATTC
jgi:malate dehydrogenase (oxaloacetate-decarboxylating)